MPTIIKVNNNTEYVDSLDENALGLSDDELKMLNEHPNAVANIWDGVAEAIAIKHWPNIMLAQIVKALKGDTASTKFLTEFVEVLAKQSGANYTTQTAWEEKAIALRDRLGVELSAEILVEMILDELDSWSLNRIRTLINRQLTRVAQADDTP